MHTVWMRYGHVSWGHIQTLSMCCITVAAASAGLDPRVTAGLTEWEAERELEEFAKVRGGGLP